MQTDDDDRPRAVFDAVILAGGRASRLDGRSKPEVLVGGRRLIDHAVAATTDARRTIVVGPPGLAALPTLTAQEDPPLGGPVAGIEAGLRVLDDASERAGEVDAPLVLLLACDIPRARDVLPRLLLIARTAVSAGLDGAQVIDPAGRSQPLLGIYRRELLTAGLGRLAATGGTRDVSVRRLLAGARVLPVRDDVGHSADADTPADIRRLDQVLRDEHSERPGSGSGGGGSPQL